VGGMRRPTRWVKRPMPTDATEDENPHDSIDDVARGVPGGWVRVCPYPVPLSSASYPAIVRGADGAVPAYITPGGHTEYVTGHIVAPMNVSDAERLRLNRVFHTSEADNRCPLGSSRVTGLRCCCCPLTSLIRMDARSDMSVVTVCILHPRTGDIGGDETLRHRLTRR
jgi:hypothetical protein